MLRKKKKQKEQAGIEESMTLTIMIPSAEDLELDMEKMMEAENESANVQKKDDQVDSNQMDV